MSLNTTEEAQVRLLLEQQSALLSLAASEPTIISKLAAAKISLADLTAASSLSAADLLLVRQGTQEKSATGTVLQSFAQTGAVLTTGNQTIAGTKTFSSAISGSITGNAATVTNGVYTTGDQTMDGALFLASGSTAPTPAQLDNDTSLATTAFVKQSGLTYAAFNSYNASTTLTAAVAGGIVEFYGTTASQTITLPLASGLRSGDTITFINDATVPVAIASQGENVIFICNNNSITSFVLKTGDSIVLASSTDAWFSLDGTGSLQYSDSFAKSLASSGYQKLPSGLIIQWGQSGPIASAGSIDITLPVAFPNGALSVSATRSTIYSQDTDNNTVSAEITTTTLTLHRSSDSSSAGSFYWTALGY